MAGAGEAIVGMLPAMIVVGGVVYIAKKLTKKQRQRGVRISKREYYCRKCKRTHRSGSRVYRSHLRYRRVR